MVDGVGRPDHPKIPSNPDMLSLSIYMYVCVCVVEADQRSSISPSSIKRQQCFRHPETSSDPTPSAGGFTAPEISRTDKFGRYLVGIILGIANRQSPHAAFETTTSQSPCKKAWNMKEMIPPWLEVWGWSSACKWERAHGDAPKLGRLSWKSDKCGCLTMIKCGY